MTQLDYKSNDQLQPLPASASLPSAPNRDILIAAKGSGIIFFGQIIDYASRFVFAIVVARWLGANDFGLYNLAITIVSILSGSVLFGLQSGIERFVPIAIQDKDEVRLRATLQASTLIVGTVSLICALITFIFADQLSVYLFHEPDLSPLMGVIGLCVLLMSIGEVLMSATRGYKQMQYPVYANAIAFNICKMALSFLFLAMGFGVSSMLTVHVISWIVTILLLLYFLDKLLPLRQAIQPAPLNVRELLNFSLPVYLTRLIIQFGGSMEIMFLGPWWGMVGVGVYSAALRIQLIGVMFLRAIESANMPIISDLHHRGLISELNQLYQVTTKWSLSFTLPFFLTLAMFAKPLLSIFGHQFETGGLALIFLGLGTLVDGGTGMCKAIIVMTGYSKLNLINSIVALLVNVLFDLLLIPIWGVEGAAAATGLSIAILNIVRTIQLYQLFKIWPYNRGFVKPIVAIMGAVLVTFILNQVISADKHYIYLIVNISCLWLSYIAVIMLLGLSSEDQIVLGRVQKRFGAMFMRR